jgi:CBS domain-containing protein
MKKVKDFMSRRVAYLKPTDTIFKAAKVFCKRGISGAPVIESSSTKRVVGVVSESDIVKFMGMNVCKSKPSDIMCSSMSLLIYQFLRMSKNQLGFKKELGKISRIKIKDVMSGHVVSISPEDSILDAAERMDAHDVNRLPVVDDNGKLVGIIARADLLKSLLK